MHIHVYGFLRWDRKIAVNYNNPHEFNQNEIEPNLLVGT